MKAIMIMLVLLLQRPHHRSKNDSHLSWLSLFTGLDYWTEVFSFFGQDSVVFQIYLTPGDLNYFLKTIEFL